MHRREKQTDPIEESVLIGKRILFVWAILIILIDSGGILMD
jgi:hypothetical protein